MLDSEQELFLEEILESLAQALTKTGADLLFDLTHKEVNQEFHCAQENLGIRAMEMEAYQNRHGGVTRGLV